MDPFPDSRPFFWHPVEGHRHAIAARDRDVLVGSQITTLCGSRLVRQQAAEFDWFWPTCMTCWTHATELLDSLHRKRTKGPAE